MPSRAERRRWRRDIVRHLEDFPRQYAALENAMTGFGDNFDARIFKAAFNTRDDMDAYNNVQAVERATSRVQNFVAELAQAGSNLAEIREAAGVHTSPSLRAFAALTQAGVITGALSRRLMQAQNARTRIEHSYVQVPAGDVHRAAELVRTASRDFIAVYRVWIEPYLETSQD